MNADSCDYCGLRIPVSAPGGICPACLLRAGLDGRSPHTGMTDHGQPVKAGDVLEPPPPEQLAAFFPHLEIVDVIGQGGMGAVYRARQIKLDRQAALKIIRPESASDPTFAERFAREARALARLNHPHIVGVYDFGEFESGYYLLMELVDGSNLRELMDAARFETGQTLSLVRQVCDALQYAHDEGVVHRDIKPENILVDQKGNVKIADFGLARLATGADGVEPANYFTLTGTQQVIGTPRYMAPEQLEASKYIDHRADIYSLGVVFYELLTGEVPMGSFDPPSRKSQIHQGLDEIVLRAMAREPERRYQTASSLSADVESASAVAAAVATGASDSRSSPVSPSNRSRHAGLTTILEREAAAVLPWIASAFDGDRARQREPTVLMLAICVLGCLAVLMPWLDISFVQQSGDGVVVPAMQDDSPISGTVFGSDCRTGLVASFMFAALAVLLIAVPRTRLPIVLAWIMVPLAAIPLLMTVMFKSESLQSAARFAQPRGQIAALTVSATPLSAPQSNVLESKLSVDVQQCQWKIGFYVSLAAAISMLAFSAVGIRHAWAEALEVSSADSSSPVGGRDWVTLTKQQINTDTLPNVCMVCGDPTKARVNRTFEWAPDWAGLLTLAGGIPGWIALATTQRKFRVSCPVCARHADHWSRYAWVCSTGWLAVLLIAAIGGFVGWAVYQQSHAGWITGLALCGALALAAWIITMIRMGLVRVRVARITKDAITFDRVSAAFARAVNGEEP